MLQFPEMTLQQKKDRLRYKNSEVARRDRVGLLGDILIQGKPNAEQFLEASGGIKPVYAEIGRMISEFSPEFMLDFVSGHLPFKPGANWKRYLWGAATSTHAKWCADNEVRKHQERMKAYEPSSAFRKMIAGEFGERFEGR